MKDILINKSAEVLERWGLFLVDRAEDSLAIFESNLPFYLAELKFKGCVEGTYQVLSQKNFAEILVSNLLGEQNNEDQDQTIKDALGELVNVLSGNLLTEQYGDEEVFDLTPPEVSIINAEDAKKFFSLQHTCYLADDQPLGIGCSLDG
jgi:chemotaxis protein CheY-P-specific phosphatase CheC